MSNMNAGWIVLVGSLMLGPLARAGFIGATVTATGEAPTPGSVFEGPKNAIVGPGAEFGFVAAPPDVLIDVADASITFAIQNNAVLFPPDPLNGFRLTFVGAPPITGVVRDPGGTMPAPLISFDADEILFNFAGIGDCPVGLTQSFSVTFAPVGVPLPPAVITGLSLSLPVLVRRVRKR